MWYCILVRNESVIYSLTGGHLIHVKNAFTFEERESRWYSSSSSSSSLEANMSRMWGHSWWTCSLSPWACSDCRINSSSYAGIPNEHLSSRSPIYSHHDLKRSETYQSRSEVPSDVLCHMRTEILHPCMHATCIKMDIYDQLSSTVPDWIYEKHGFFISRECSIATMSWMVLERLKDEGGAFYWILAQGEKLTELRPTKVSLVDTHHLHHPYQRILCICCELDTAVRYNDMRWWSCTCPFFVSLFRRWLFWNSWAGWSYSMCTILAESSNLCDPLNAQNLLLKNSYTYSNVVF